TFERATGLSEAMYGATPQKQMRSAQEAALKGDMLRLRPDDMAERVETAATMMGRKEAVAAAWALRSNDVRPILGPTGAQFWDMLVAGGDFQSLVHEYDYRLEAGSSRKPNRDRQVADTTEGVQTLLPIFAQDASANGDDGANKACVRDRCEGRELERAG